MNWSYAIEQTEALEAEWRATFLQKDAALQETAHCISQMEQRYEHKAKELEAIYQRAAEQEEAMQELYQRHQSLQRELDQAHQEQAREKVRADELTEDVVVAKAEEQVQSAKVNDLIQQLARKELEGIRLKERLEAQSRDNQQLQQKLDSQRLAMEESVRSLASTSLDSESCLSLVTVDGVTRLQLGTVLSSVLEHSSDDSSDESTDDQALASPDDGKQTSKTRATEAVLNATDDPEECLQQVEKLLHLIRTRLHLQHKPDALWARAGQSLSYRVSSDAISLMDLLDAKWAQDLNKAAHGDQSGVAVHPVLHNELHRTNTL